MTDITLKAEYGAEDRPLEIGDFQLPCYVLNNGQRVLSRNGMLKAIGLSKGSSAIKGGDRLARFVQGQRLNNFISNDLIEVIKSPIEFELRAGPLLSVMMRRFCNK